VSISVPRYRFSVSPDELVMAADELTPAGIPESCESLQRRHPAAFLRSDERCTLASNSVEHCAKVVDPRVHVGKEVGTVGQSRSTLVEDDHPRE
jgi:hypothetical protein